MGGGNGRDKYGFRGYLLVRTVSKEKIELDYEYYKVNILI